MHQALVLDGAHTVVDAFDLEQVQGFPDVLRRTFLARVGDGEEALAAGAVEHPLELARRVALLRAVQAHGNEGVAVGQGLVQGLLRFFFGEVAEEAQDQPGADAQLLAAVLQRLADAGQHHLEGDAPVGMGLGIEEGLGVDHVLRLAALQVGPGQVVEILLGAQHVGAGVVEVEELLQVVEGVRLAQGLHVGPGQGHLVALGQGEQQFGLQGTFQVQVQFSLGQGVQPVVHGGFSLSGMVAGKFNPCRGEFIRQGRQSRPDRWGLGVF
ncbi:hypothetical protein FQZ97_627620 [compost metagenome]